METKMTFLSELKRLKEAAKGFGKDTSPDVIVAMIDLQAHLVNHAEAIEELVSAAENLRDVKGRHHTEIATTQLFEALAKLEKP